MRRRRRKACCRVLHHLVLALGKANVDVRAHTHTYSQNQDYYASGLFISHYRVVLGTFISHSTRRIPSLDR